MDTIAAKPASIRLNLRIPVSFCLIVERPEKHKPGGFVQRVRLEL
jgi:hypothetical protein